MEEQKKKNNVWKILTVIIACVLVCVIVIQVLPKKDSKNQEETTQSLMQNGQLGYQGNVVVSDQDDLQALADGMMERAQEGNMALEMQNVARSTDGKKFACYIANSIKNSYDMFLAIYLDDALTDQVMITGLIAPGSAIDNFETSKKIENNTSAYLVLTQVEADRSTIHSQVVVQIDLKVE